MWLVRWWCLVLAVICLLSLLNFCSHLASLAHWLYCRWAFIACAPLVLYTFGVYDVVKAKSGVPHPPRHPFHYVKMRSGLFESNSWTECDSQPYYLLGLKSVEMSETEDYWLTCMVITGYDPSCASPPKPWMSLNSIFNSVCVLS